MDLNFSSPIPPSVNHYLGWRAIKRSGKSVVLSYETKEAKVYKSALKKIVIDAVNAQKWTRDPIETRHYYVDCVFYFDRIDMDSSNYDKCLLDAITETQLIWKDDNVALVRAQAVYYDTNNPRIEVTIHPVDYIGIFQNDESLAIFNKRCTNCKRNLSNCSLYKGAIEGRIREEIQQCVCLKYKEKAISTKMGA